MLQQKTSKIAFSWNGSLGVTKLVVFVLEKVPVSLPRSFHAQKNRAELYVRELIETDELSDLSSRTDALATYEVDPLSSHRATKKTKKSNKKSNVRQREDSHSLASTSSEEETQIEAPKCDADPAGTSAHAKPPV